MCFSKTGEQGRTLCKYTGLQEFPFLIPLSQAGPFYSEYYEKENIMAVSATGNLCHKNKYLFQFSLQLA